MKNKKLMIYILVGIIIISFLIFLYINYYPQEEYENALNKIDYYKDLCESAGFIFEIKGHLKSPEEQNENFNMDWNEVELICYELRNDIKIYYNLRDFEKVGGLR